jgi:hypothetical protein
MDSFMAHGSLSATGLGFVCGSGRLLWSLSMAFIASIRMLSLHLHEPGTVHRRVARTRWPLSLPLAFMWTRTKNRLQVDGQKDSGHESTMLKELGHTPAEQIAADQV